MNSTQQIFRSTLRFDQPAQAGCHTTIKAKTVNGELQLQALVDGKKIIITELTVRRDLQLKDAEGVDGLPNATIFEQLALISLKTTTWNEFSSTMASAIICLAINQKFNFSKFIFEIMLKNLDNVGKFLMYPRKPKRKDTQVPQSSIPSDNVADEAVYKELDDSLVRAATTASSLEAERVNKLEKKDRSRTHKLKRLYKVGLSARVESSRDEEDLGEDVSEQGRRIHDIDADKDITLVNDDNEIFDVDALAGEEVFVAEQSENVVEEVVDMIDAASTIPVSATIITDVQITLAQVLAELKSAKPKADKVVIQEPEHVGIHDIDADEDITLVNDDNEIFDVDALACKEVFVAKKSGNVVEEVVDVIEAASIILASSATITDVEITLAQALAELKSTKPKADKVMIQESEDVKPMKRLEQIRLDEELAFKLQAEEEEEERLAREKAQQIEEANIAWDDVQAKIFDVDALACEEVFVAKKSGNVVEEVVDVIEAASIIPSSSAIITDVKITLAQALAELKSTKPKADKDKGKGIMIEEPVVEQVKPMKRLEQMRLDEELAFKLQAEEEEEESSNSFIEDATCVHSYVGREEISPYTIYNYRYVEQEASVFNEKLEDLQKNTPVLGRGYMDSTGLGVLPTIEEPIKMYCDNTRAIAIEKDHGVTKGSRSRSRGNTSSHRFGYQKSRSLDQGIGDSNRANEQGVTGKGIGRLPSSTETNQWDHVKSISTTVEADTRPIRRIDNIRHAVSGPQDRRYARGCKDPIDPWRSFLSTAHAKIDVFKRKMALRVGSDKIMIQIDKPTSNIIRRVYVLSLRKRMKLDLESRLMGEALMVNRSRDPDFEDFIELNDLNKPLELRQNQVEDLGPIIEEGEVIYAPTKDIVKTRSDNDMMTNGIKDYPSSCDYRRKVHINGAYNLKFSRMIGYKLIHANLFLLLSINLMSKSFYSSIIKDKIEYERKNVFRTFMNVPIFVGNFSVLTNFIVLKDMDAYRDEGMGDVIVGKLFCREIGVKARRFEGMITIYNGNDEVTYQMVQSHLRFKYLTNAQCNKILPLLKVSEQDKLNGISHSYQKLKTFYKGVLNLGPEYIRDEKMEEWLTHGHVSVHEMEW
ncbi:hypothetical protein Tco_1002659 [Tanacetum coccineum]|uniref:Uncharacterized protein n=1 Tax=Tanacetum coccineum TaxID=301880 RepID=A0ABQ5F6Y9_9ASTR